VSGASLEYLERLEVEPRGERWLAREGEALRNIVVHRDEDPDWLDGIAEGTQPWVGWEHPHVIPIYRLARYPRLTLVTGDERGSSFVRSARALPVGDRGREAWCVTQIAAIARAVAAMARHVPEFVHRRACDENIVIGATGRARLRAPVAFVAAGPLPGYLGRGHALVGARWLAPEQVRGKHASPQTDVFQLASTLYAALTGAHPVTGRGDFELLEAIADGPPPPPPATTDPRLGDLIVRALARDRATRPASPALFADELAACDLDGDLDAARAQIAAARPVPHLAPRESVGVVGDRCPRRWDDLHASDDPSVRHCDFCALDVVRVRSIDALLPLLGRRCVAFSDDN
jgi:hypothetical protein